MAEIEDTARAVDQTVDTLLMLGLSTKELRQVTEQVGPLGSLSGWSRSIFVAISSWLRFQVLQVYRWRIVTTMEHVTMFHYILFGFAVLEAIIWPVIFVLLPVARKAFAERCAPLLLLLTPGMVGLWGGFSYDATAHFFVVPLVLLLMVLGPARIAKVPVLGPALIRVLFGRLPWTRKSLGDSDQFPHDDYGQPEVQLWKWQSGDSRERKFCVNLDKFMSWDVHLCLGFIIKAHSTKPVGCCWPRCTVWVLAVVLTLAAVWTLESRRNRSIIRAFCFGGKCCLLPAFDRLALPWMLTSKSQLDATQKPLSRSDIQLFAIKSQLFARLHRSSEPFWAAPIRGLDGDLFLGVWVSALIILWSYSDKRDLWRSEMFSQDFKNLSDRFCPMPIFWFFTRLGATWASAPTYRCWIPPCAESRTLRWLRGLIQKLWESSWSCGSLVVCEPDLLLVACCRMVVSSYLSSWSILRKVLDWRRSLLESPWHYGHYLLHMLCRKQQCSM